MIKVLVLGGDGFIGSHLIDALVARSFDVTCYSLLNGKSVNNLKHLEGKIKIIDGDFLDLKALDIALEGIDYVFHMISLSTPASSIDDHLLDIEKNVIGTIRLLEMCQKHKIKKIIYPSSGGAIYGDHKIDKYTETTPTNPISPYGISKLTIEKYLHYFYHMYGLDYLIFRISNPYGVRQDPEGKQGLIGISLNAIKNNESMNIYGDGNNIRDYIYVTDVTSIIARVFDSTTKHHLYNLGSGIGYSINDILATYREVIKPNFKVSYLDERKSDVRKIVLDTTRIENEFGFKPKISIKEGIKLTWNYLKDA